MKKKTLGLLALVLMLAGTKVERCVRTSER